MSRLRIAFFVVGLFAALAVGVVLFAFYNLNRPPIPPKQIENAQIALKGALGEAILGEHGSPVAIEPSDGKTGLDALLTPPPGDKGKGLIAEYQQNPQKFKQYADMLDTALNAKQLGEIVLSHASGERIPGTSEALAVQPNLRFDAWGSPFCILRIDERLAIISGGPSRVPCQALPLTTAQLAASKRNMYAGPSNVVVVIVTRKQRQPTPAPAKPS